MAPRAAVVLAFAVCFLLVAPAPARRPIDLPRQLREAAAEKLQPTKLVQVADAEAADQATVIAVPKEEGTALAVQKEVRPEKQSSLLCLVFRCSGTHELQALDGWAQPAVAGTAEEEEGAYDSDSDSDWDSDCDSDDEDEGGIVGWFWRLADGF